MANWQDLVDLSTELKVTAEGRAVLEWATLFHIRGKHSVKQRRSLMAVASEPDPDVVALGQRMADYRASLQDE